MMKKSSRFADLLAPVSSAQFFAEYWETAPLHIGRSDSQYFADLVSLADIESALSCHEFSFPAVQLTHAGHSVPTTEYTDHTNRIVVSRLLQKHQQGATVVMSSAQKYLPRLGELAQATQASLQLRTQTNVYLSPAGRQGFNPHFDSHDVFILQVGGKKTFRFYAGGAELPFSENSFDPDQVEIGSLEETIQLEAGDTLYIPRGVIHDAVADDSEPSLHITMGVYALTVRTLLQEILQLASEKDIDYRKSIDHQLWQQGDPQQKSVGRRLQQLLSNAFSENNFNEALARLRDDVALDTPPDCQGWLTGARELHADSLLKVRDKQILSVEVNTDGLTLRVAGGIIQFEPTMIEAIEYLLKHGEVAVSGLPGLHADQQVALANRLCQEHIVDAID